MILLSLFLSPHGHLGISEEPGVWPMDPALAQRLREAFGPGSGPGLLHLGARETLSTLPPEFAYWRDFGARYMKRVCGFSEGQDQ